MQNHRTLFGRSFKVNIAVIAFTVLLLIVVLSVGIRSFYITDAVSALKESGELLNEVYVSSYGNDDAGKTIKEIAGAVCRYQASDIEIYDRYGYVWISCTGGDMLLAEREDIKSDNLQNIEGGYAYANENNVYSTPIVTVQTELRVDGQLKGYVVQHQRLNAYEKPCVLSLNG